MPQQLINVILDRVIDQQALIDKAHVESTDSKAMIKRAARAAASVTVGGVEQRRQAFRRFFVRVAIAEYAKHLQSAIKISHESLNAEVVAAKAVGPDKIKTIPALRKPDVMRRAAERAGLRGGK